LGEILSAYKINFTSSGQAMQLLLTENMKIIPALILGLLRNAAFRASSMIPSDLRSYLLSMLYSAPPEVISVMLYPRFWRLHALQPQEGIRLDNGQIQYPPRLNLSSEKLERHGIFMMDTVFEIFIWVGRATSPELMRDMFGKYYDQLADGKTKLPELKTDLNQRLLTLVKDIQSTRLRTMTLSPTLYIVREDGDPNMRAWFLSYMVEDRLDTTPSYPQFLAQLREQIAK
jgi:protein transport protein SEC24